MDKEIGDCNAAQKTFRSDLDLLEDRTMDVEMSTSGAHCMIREVKEEVQELSTLCGNLSNQVETMQVDGIAWCRSRISVLEKPNNPANKSPSAKRSSYCETLWCCGDRTARDRHRHTPLAHSATHSRSVKSNFAVTL
jgi:hypothetical protein